MKTHSTSRAFFQKAAVTLTAASFICGFFIPSAQAQYTIEDGTAETSFGVSGGGSLIVFNSFATLPTNNVINSISIAFGAPGAAGASLNGTSFQAVLWSDPNGDGNPTDAVVLAVANAVVSGYGTNTFVTVSIAPTLVTTANFFVGFQINHAAQQFPAALDTTAPSFANRSFIIASNNINNLSGAFTSEDLGSNGNWLIRANSASTVPESGSTIALLTLALAGLLSSGLIGRRLSVSA